MVFSPTENPECLRPDFPPWAVIRSTVLLLKRIDSLPVKIVAKTERYTQQGRQFFGFNLKATVPRVTPLKLVVRVCTCVCECFVDMLVCFCLDSYAVHVCLCSCMCMCVSRELSTREEWFCLAPALVSTSLISKTKHC